MIFLIIVFLITLNADCLLAGEKNRLERFEETGFFLMITLAEGYRLEDAYPNTSIIEPVNPSENFAEDIPEVYSVFHFRPNMTSFELWVRVIEGKAEDSSSGKEVGLDGVMITAGENSAVLRLPAPSQGWSKGEYMAEFFVNAPIRNNLERVIKFTVSPLK